MRLTFQERQNKMDSLLGDPRYLIKEDGSFWMWVDRENEWKQRGTSTSAKYYSSIHYKGSSFYVHRLVYRKYVGPLLEGFEINHKDGNKKNNHVSNLEQVTPYENQIHALRTGLRVSIGEYSKQRSIILKKEKNEALQKMKSRYAKDIIGHLQGGCTPSCVAKRLGVTRMFVCKMDWEFFR